LIIARRVLRAAKFSSLFALILARLVLLFGLPQHPDPPFLTVAALGIGMLGRTG
jgi:hypothetical protein